MLEEISIQNLGVIQEATLPFTKGLTVITGETGAGKTMVLTALSLLLGKRSDSSIVRHGTEFTSVEGCWNVTNLNILPEIQEVGAIIEDGNLYMNRTVYKDGKSRAVIGGKTTPASVLAKIGDGLVNIHGQSDQIRLKSSAAQREALDSFAKEQLTKILEEYRQTYTSWKEKLVLLKEIKTNMVAREREYEELIRAIEEISTINPKPGEDEELKNEADMLSNVESLTEAATIAQEALSSENYETVNVLDGISRTIKALSNVSNYDPNIKELYELAVNTQINALELSSGLATYLNGLDMNSLERLNEVQERRATINTLIRKYGITLEDVIEYAEKAQERVTSLDPKNINIENLEAELETLKTELATQSKKLTQIRKIKSSELVTAVNLELAGLAMGGNKLEIAITTSETYTINGCDEINFMLKTAGASEARPLNKSASGGELSRIMLALEVVIADPEVTPTFIFDEVDSGVGGATAIEIGKRLSQLATEAQVIVVTHLPQVAVFADNHLRVLKNNSDTFVSTDVNQLTEPERIEELARMLSGLTNSETGKSHAAELIEMAKQYKNK